MHVKRPADSPADVGLDYLEVLEEEYWKLSGQEVPENPLRAAYAEARRRLADADGDDPDAVAAAKLARDQAESAYRHQLLGVLHGAGRTALCFSGGGIRSATF